MKAVMLAHIGHYFEQADFRLQHHVTYLSPNKCWLCDAVRELQPREPVLNVTGSTSASVTQGQASLQAAQQDFITRSVQSCQHCIVALINIIGRAALGCFWVQRLPS